MKISAMSGVGSEYISGSGGEFVGLDVPFRSFRPIWDAARVAFVRNNKLLEMQAPMRYHVVVVALFSWSAGDSAGCDEGTTDISWSSCGSLLMMVLW